MEISSTIDAEEGDKMLNIAICDDDVKTTGTLEMLIRRIAKRNFIDVETEVFWDGKSLADAVRDGNYFDIIYLDIEMDKEDGITDSVKNFV